MTAGERDFMYSGCPAFPSVVLQVTDPFIEVCDDVDQLPDLQFHP